MPFVEKVLETPNNWMIYSTALLLRSRLEFGKNRMVERATLQVQALVDQIPLEEPEEHIRLRYIFQLATPSKWELEKEVATMFCRLGAFKTALEIYERLNMWDESISCYIQIDQKEKAEKIILQELTKEKTPKLLCILGDVKNEKIYYEEAWDLSNQRYSRAQRSLGYLYFNEGEVRNC